MAGVLPQMLQINLLSGSSIAEINRNDLRDVRHLYTAVGNILPTDMFTLLDG